MVKRIWSYGTGALGVALVGLVYCACNPILDIEPAENDGCAPNTPPGPCSGSQERCSTCVRDKCGLNFSECLADDPCRKFVDFYRNCLDLVDPTSCDERTNSNGARSADCCAQKYLTQSDKASALGDCASELCPSECQGAPLLDPCVAFCTCMPKNCAGIDLGEGGAGGAEYWDDVIQNCDADCRAMSVDQWNCQITHCDIAGGSHADKELHCRHAVGRGCYEMVD